MCGHVVSVFESQRLLIVIYNPGNFGIQIGGFPSVGQGRTRTLGSAEEDYMIFSEVTVS